MSPWSNQLQSIRHDAFSGLHELVELGLDGNALESLPEGLFAGMSRLSDLGSSGNRISSLPRSIFHGLSALHELSLDRNEIRSLYTDSFTDLGELTWLSIRENALESLPRGVFSNLSKLDYLLLDENRLETLPNGVFHGLSKLSNLGLSRNQPRSLPDDVFRRPGNLLRLSLDHNQLHSLPDGVFEGLVRLAYLHLSDNNLSALPQNVFGDLGNLRELDLWQNQLTTLPPGTFAGIDKLVRLNLDKNPGAPFALSIKLRQTDATSFVLEAPLGIPVAVVASLSATGGTLFESDRPGATSPGKVLSVVLPAGYVAGQRISVVPDKGDDPVDVRLTLQPPPGDRDTTRCKESTWSANPGHHKRRPSGDVFGNSRSQRWPYYSTGSVPRRANAAPGAVLAGSGEFPVARRVERVASLQGAVGDHRLTDPASVFRQQVEHFARHRR